MQRQGQEHRARERHRHAVARLHAARAQQVCQRDHLLAQLAVVQFSMGIRQRGGVRRFARLLRHKIRQRGGRQRQPGIVDARQPGVFLL